MNGQAAARRLMVGFDPKNRKIVLAIASNLGRVDVALTPTQARDLVRQIEDLAGRMELTGFENRGKDGSV